MHEGAGPCRADSARAGQRSRRSGFCDFEKRLPRVGVHLGLRRDCGSTFAPGRHDRRPSPATSSAKYVFEGTIRNFPSPIVEKDNVNYLAGVREIGVRSEYTDGRDMPRLLIRSVEFEGPVLRDVAAAVAPKSSSISTARTTTQA